MLSTESQRMLSEEKDAEDQSRMRTKLVKNWQEAFVVAKPDICHSHYHGQEWSIIWMPITSCAMLMNGSSLRLRWRHSAVVYCGLKLLIDIDHKLGVGYQRAVSDGGLTRLGRSSRRAMITFYWI